MPAQKPTRGANLGQLGAFNQAVVLHAIRRGDGTSRVEICHATGLAGQTVTNICRRLLLEGLIFEGKPVANGMGKPRTPLRINTEARHALGVHIDPAQTTVVLLNFEGTPVLAERFVTPLNSVEPVKTIRQIGEKIVGLVESSGIDWHQIAGVGAATPGPLDISLGEIHQPPHLPGWQQVPVREVLSSVVGLPVRLEKDVIAAAVAETWAGTFANSATAALLYLGTGVGAGLVVNGEVLRGTSNNAGEIGHLVVEPDGAECSCGQRGCVNVTLAAEAIVQRAGNGDSPATLIELDTEVRKIYDRADADERRALEVVRGAATSLARLALAIANMLDLEMLVLGGPYWSRMSPYFFNAASNLLPNHAPGHRPRPIRLLGTPVGENLAAVGAASLVLDEIYSPRLGSLVLDSR